MPTHRRTRPTMREYGRYWFDSVMSKGMWGMMLIVFIGGAILVAFTTVFSWILNYVLSGQGSLAELPHLFWSEYAVVMRVGDGEGHWVDQLGTLVVSLIAIFFTGVVFGQALRDIGMKIGRLRDKGGVVVSQNHTVIVGWSQLGHRLITELALANGNQHKPTIAILAPRDKFRTEQEIGRDDTRNSRILVRTGRPTSMSSFDLVRLHDAAKVVVLGEWGGRGYDDRVIATLLALARYREQHPEFDASVVAAVIDPSNVPPAQVAAKYPAAILNVRSFLSRMILEMCLQPGLYSVYEQLFRFEGDELYLVSEPALAGCTFGEALSAYPTSTPIGLVTEEGTFLNPDFASVIGERDQLVVLTADDDTALLGPPEPIDEAAIVAHSGQVGAAEAGTNKVRRWLLIGWSQTVPDLVSELDAYASGPVDIEAVIRPDDEPWAAAAQHHDYANARFVVRSWADDISVDRLITEVDPASWDYIIIFNQGGAEPDLQDEFSLMILLQLRDTLAALPEADQPVVVTELLNEDYRKIADSSDAKDMVVNAEMVALMLSQLTEAPGLLPIFEDLCDADGSEIYLKSVDRYVQVDHPVAFATIVEAARRRGEIAIGYRLASEARELKARHGVHLNPPKGATVTLNSQDLVIVVAEDAGRDW